MQISDYVSIEVILMVVIILALFILVKLLFKFVSMPKLVKGLVITATFVGVFLMLHSYIEKEEEAFLSEPKIYMDGKVSFVSKSLNKVRLDSVKYSGKLIGEVVVKVPDSTQIYIENEYGKSVKTTIDSLKTGCKVRVIIREAIDTKNKDDITAVKILIRGE